MPTTGFVFTKDAADRTQRAVQIVERTQTTGKRPLRARIVGGGAPIVYKVITDEDGDNEVDVKPVDSEGFTDDDVDAIQLKVLP